MAVDHPFYLTVSLCGRHVLFLCIESSKCLDCNRVNDAPFFGACQLPFWRIPPERAQCEEQGC